MEYPTLYEYYTGGGISAGLSGDQTFFTLNHKSITLYSGALHYFRVPPAYWRDRLRKLRAAGLNAVETYIPWNLHEPERGIFDFGSGSTEFEELLDIRKYLKIAQEEDLLAIVRPGPYICSEWEFGGLPSWILRSDTKIRTSDPKFIDLVKNYFAALLPILADLQFTNNGPIIALQIENEYGNTKVGDDPVDTEYLNILKQLFLENCITELLFTSDTPSNGFSGTLPGVLATANFQDKPNYELTLLKEHQPNKPLMVMEYWTGWFDHWTEKHHTRPNDQFGQVLDEILAFGASVNMYMFHGGTNWGFLNGANVRDLTIDNSAYQPDTSSYDYDAPLSEAGDYTDKYCRVKELINKYNKVQTKLPKEPVLMKRIAFLEIDIQNMLSLDDLIKQSDHTISSQKLVPMEALNINNNSGQSYGYIVYRKANLTIPENSVLKIEGHVCDTVIVLINGQLMSPILQTQRDLNGFGYWKLKDSTLNLGERSYADATLDLLVENCGRNNYGKLNQFNQHKGLWQGNVLINEAVLNQWQIIPLQFKKDWTNSLKNWKPFEKTVGPAMYKAILNIEQVGDTFVDMRQWTKGITIVNGFVLARHFKLGPQQTAYLPAPFLRSGSNTIIVFEHFRPSSSVTFVSDPIFQTLE